jgi:LmbE family N-acetylglucosaminyl deacetylase
MTMSQKVLVLTAHPDDAEFFAGGTLARMVAAGAEVTTLIATNGDKGSFELDAVRLAEVRRMETLRAAGILGVREVVFLDYHDGELDQLEAGRLREQFVRAIRERRPDVLFTFDPFAPFDDHPDDRAVAFAALEAVNFASYPLYYPEQLAEGLEPHLVAEKYFFAKHVAHADKAVDIAETLQTKIAAILEHKSQVAFLAEEATRQAAVAGVDIGDVVPGSGVGREGAARMITWVVRERARADGAAVGLEFAERFRYTRFSPMLEALLEAQGRASNAP